MESALPVNLNQFVKEDEYHHVVSTMLQMAKQYGATQAEVGLHASRGLNVSVRLNEIETLEFNRDKAVGITVYIDQKKGSASTTDISKESLESTVKAAIALAKLTEPDPYSGLADKSEMATEILPLDLYHPWDLEVSTAINQAKICEKTAMSLDKRIVNSEGASLSSTQSYHVYANSYGFVGYYPTSRHSVSCVVIAQDAQGMERDHEYTIARNFRLLDSPEKVGLAAAEKVLKRLSAKKLPTQRIPVLFHASVATGIWNHFIGAISGGRLFRRSSFLLDSLGKKIFPEHIHIYERPHVLGGLGSAPFDNDGVFTSNKDFVLNGEVKSYVLSAYSARKLNLPNTGNSGGVHNVFIDSTGEDFEALLKKMGRGLVVTELMGQGINLVTGDYSRGAAGFWVEDGQIQYPVHEVTIAGNLLNMFNHISAVGTDTEIRGNIQTGSILIDEMMLAGV